MENMTERWIIANIETHVLMIFEYFANLNDLFGSWRQAF